MVNRKLVLDTETTGLDINKGDRIIEIGIVELIDNLKTGSTYHTYLNPLKQISNAAEKIHGLNNKFLEDKPKFHDIVNELNDFIDDSVLIMHNAEFDKTFINFELENCGEKALSNKIVDTLTIARKHFPGQSVNLDALCKKLKVDNSQRKIHGALLDADLLATVYLKMISGKQSSMNLIYSGNEDFRIEKKSLNSNDIKFPERKHLTILPENEYQDHKTFLKTFENPIWNLIDKS